MLCRLAEYALRRHNFPQSDRLLQYIVEQLIKLCAHEDVQTALAELTGCLCDLPFLCPTSAQDHRI